VPATALGARRRRRLSIATPPSVRTTLERGPRRITLDMYFLLDGCPDE
jgi:hypothetical protein